MKSVLLILLLFPFFLPAQARPLSAYEQALRQQEARRQAQAEKAQALRNRYRYTPSKPSSGNARARSVAPTYRAAVKKAPLPPAPRKVQKKSAPPRKNVYTSPKKSAPPRKNVYTSPKTPKKITPSERRVYISPKVSAGKVSPAKPPLPVRPAPRPSGKIGTVRIGQNVYFYLRDVAAYYRMRLKFHKDGVEMYTLTGNKVRFYKKKRTAYLNSTLVHLLFPLYLRGNTGYFIHSEDVRVLLHPILRTKRTVTSGRQKVIMLDPGHGGSDTGALVPSLREKDMNLVMAYKVRKVLTAFGYKVILTRAKDTTLTLKQRAELCRKWKPDIFVSIHCNAAGDKKVRGIETFATTPRNTPSTGKKKPAHTKADPGNKFDAENFRLAYLVQRSLLSYTAAPDRGVRHARFLVIREAIAPAVLIEIGFLTNPQEVKLFRTGAYQNKMANGIAVGIHLFAKEK